jgi:hypothetical protein
MQDTGRQQELIRSPSELRPDTAWRETVWAWTPEENLVDHCTRSRLCGAALLPFLEGRPDWKGFIDAIRWMYSAAEAHGVEFVPVLNADTGYIFDLTEATYAEALRRFREEFPGRCFIAGVTARGHEQDTGFEADRYLPLLDIAQSYEHCEVMLMTSRHLSALDPERRCDAYYELAEYVVRPAIVHALEPTFVPWATTFEPWLLYQLAMHPKFGGGKISTLDEPHFLYWAALCRDQKLDFVPHSGDDFGIATAIKLGLPLLVGAAASSAPVICAAKDMWLLDSVPEKRRKTGFGGFDTRVYKLLEALQSLEDQVFRLDANGSAGAYKHGTACLLKELGIIAAAEAHPACRDLRAAGEDVRMAEALRRASRAMAKLGIAW